MQTKISISNKIILGLALLFMVLTTSAYAISRVLENEGKVVEGVTLKDIALGNQSKENVINTLQQMENKLQSKIVILKYNNKKWPIRLKEIGIKVDREGIYDEAFKVGRQGNWLEQIKDRKRISKYKKAIHLSFNFNKKLLISQTKKKTKELRINPINASYKITSNYKLALIPGKNGIDVDYTPLASQIREIILNDTNPEIALKLRTIKPQISNKDIINMKVNGVVASFTTRFDASKISRAFNVTRGTRTLDDVVIKPGEVFSFNKNVGPRSKKNGYREAPEIQNNTLVNGVGGGICQVSTTLFNTVLLANLPVIERSNHSIPVHYVPLGRDATVTYGGRDFKFKNNTDGYLIIKTRAGKGSITFLLLGNLANKKRVDISAKTLYQISSKKVITKVDNNLYKGQTVVEQAGSSGYRIRVVQTVWSDGKKVRTVVFYSTYNPKTKIIRIGNKKRPITPPKKIIKKEPPVNNSEENIPQSRDQAETPAEPSA